MNREEAIEWLTDIKNITENWSQEVAIDMAIEALSADVVHGEWVDWLGNGNEWECSVCKCSIESHGSIAYNYCPMCGARMI